MDEYNDKENKTNEPWDCFYKVVDAIKDEQKGVVEYTELLKAATKLRQTELVNIITSVLNKEKQHIVHLTNWLKTKGIDLIS